MDTLTLAADATPTRLKSTLTGTHHRAVAKVVWVNIFKTGEVGRLFFSRQEAAKGALIARELFGDVVAYRVKIRPHHKGA